MLLLKQGTPETMQATTTADPFLMSLDTLENQLEWTQVESHTTAENIIAAIVVNGPTDYQYAYTQLSAANDAEKAQFAQALQDDHCAEVYYPSSFPIGQVVNIGGSVLSMRID